MTISFIMPAYKAMFLKDAIDSIVKQTYPDWELVIIDDCSPDNLEAVINMFKDPRISYHRNEKNLGGENLVNQWNHSLSFANGDWVVLAGDDDMYDQHFCEDVSNLALKYPKANLIRSRVEQIGQKNEHIWDDNMFDEFTNCYEFLNNWITGKAFTCVGNYAFRRKALESIGGFMNFPCAFCSDVATPIILAKNGVANTSGLLFKFRQSPYHLSGNQSKLKDKLEAIAGFYDWLESFEYPEPDKQNDIILYSIKNSSYLHSKRIYDYFNHILKYLPFSGMLKMLKKCRGTSPVEKIIMVLRWLKNKAQLRLNLSGKHQY